MINIYYIDDEPLVHLDSTKKIKSFLWKVMYKRVKSKMNKSLITPQNIKKIIFSKYITDTITYNSPLPNVIVHKGANWYLADDSNEYYVPLAIGFSNEKIRFDVVLIDGEIELRNVEVDEKKIVLKHKPMLLIKNLHILELCFELLLEHLEKMEKDGF